MTACFGVGVVGRKGVGVARQGPRYASPNTHNTAYTPRYGLFEGLIGSCPAPDVAISGDTSGQASSQRTGRLRLNHAERSGSIFPGDRGEDLDCSLGLIPQNRAAASGRTIFR